MEHKILDVSIRDSYYYSGRTPSISDVEVVVDTLVNMGINNIEIGYCETQASSKKSRNFLLGGNEEYNNFLAKKFQQNQQLRFFIMIHPHKCMDLEELEKAVKADFIYGVRILYKESYKELIEKQISICKKYHKKVYLNVTRITEKDNQAIEEAFHFAVKKQSDGFYIADSNSNILCDEFAELLLNLKQLSTHYHRGEMILGFHPHDGLGMALANTLLSLDHGFDMIDGSFILPFGKFQY
ncbi:MAG: hypothetical protein R3B93_07610 [Bacteroidia bacterium]